MVKLLASYDCLLMLKFTVFHVSLLKKHIGNTPITVGELLEMDANGCCPLEPNSIMQRRIIMRNLNELIQWLIQWKGMTPENASWEDAYFIQKQFPSFQY